MKERHKYYIKGATSSWG